MTANVTDRLIRYEDLVPCSLAFIDCKIAGSDRKVNYSIIGAGVTQSGEQVVNLAEPHGFALGVAAMPHGVTNNLHMHFTAEVFMIYRGEWRFRWGPKGTDGEIVGRAGDVISMPTWIFRGFTNIGPDNSWIFTLLGRDESGGVVWHPSILSDAADHGLYLKSDNQMVDVGAGNPPPVGVELVRPLTPADIAQMPSYAVADMEARVVRAQDRQWSSRSLLDQILPGHGSALAPVIGAGMTEDRHSTPKITNPHGFMVEWLRIDTHQQVGRHRVDAKQVIIVREGAVRISWTQDGIDRQAVAEPWSTFSIPGGVWRSLRAVSNEPALMSLTTAGDARPIIEWDRTIVAKAQTMARHAIRMVTLHPLTSYRLPDMRANTLRTVHRSGGAIVNAWLSIGAPYAAESICYQGFDSATIDCQHGLIGYDTAVAMLHAISSTPAVPLVRPSGLVPGEIMRFLDAGSYGIICPMISTAEDARALVAACRYPPAGTRSFGPARAQLSGGSDYRLYANDEILVLAMIETAEGLANLDAIVSTPGIDGVYVGPNDLSLALGFEPRNEPDERKVRNAIEPIRAACVARGLIAGIFASDGDAARRRVAEGFNLVTPGNDAALLRAMMAGEVSKSRAVT